MASAKPIRHSGKEPVPSKPKMRYTFTPDAEGKIDQYFIFKGMLSRQEPPSPEPTQDRPETDAIEPVKLEAPNEDDEIIALQARIDELRAKKRIKTEHQDASARPPIRSRDIIDLSGE
ncbi:hypothetical protein BCR39DRAFT_508096 [Naematelia encephala]|uniref:Uncharacterized protein n=1 Tax=Naematelia encephala TaxID=71784 RepID=A0A1Y2AIT8_9TREE|nr:hypothetical protein BCR39DRAFT_508096 [Naematelia encephala]